MKAIPVDRDVSGDGQTLPPACHFASYIPRRLPSIRIRKLMPGHTLTAGRQVVSRDTGSDIAPIAAGLAASSMASLTASEPVERTRSAMSRLRLRAEVDSVRRCDEQGGKSKAG
jgi:hypothetical protein